MRLLNIALIIFSCICFYNCANDKSVETINNNTTQQHDNTSTTVKFRQVNAQKSGIDFVNRVDELNPKINIFFYLHCYNGAGVGTGDLNNDDLPDIFFQSNFDGAFLYANEGNMKFKKINLNENLFNKNAFGTGISLVDINADGLLDVYLCYSGPKNMPQNLKANKLLINKGNFQFEEQAAKYGLASTDNSSHASFFDYDKDGDLDMYLVNTNSNFDITHKLYDLKKFQHGHPLIEQSYAQDRLYRNDGGKFTDVTRSAGLVPEMYFGFNASLGDFNDDGWTDIYVTNDFISPELLYINNGNGTFTESRQNYFQHTAYNGMGSDVSDFNNDGLDDLCVADMLAEDYKRSRVAMGMVDPGFFRAMIESGHHRQYAHNMLHINTGNNSLKEIAQFAGIQKTDWSWAVLAEDYDNNGFKDLYITNGIGRDINHVDAKQRRTQRIMNAGQKLTMEDFKNMVSMMPSQKLSNYLFLNNGEHKFTKATRSAGVSEPGFSQGAATADFDNDGDIDIVVNNFNETAFLLENTSKSGNYIQFKFDGAKQNPFGMGAKVCIYYNENVQCSNMFVTRGYLSSTDYKLHFGLGENASIERAEITWADGKFQSIDNPKTNTLHTISHKNATSNISPKNNFQKTLKEIKNNNFGKHIANDYNDFNDQILLPHKLSELGPALATADVNGDGKDDLYIGGGNAQAGAIYMQNASGQFTASNQSTFTVDKAFEDTDAMFFDSDKDGDMDLLVTSGSYEYADNAPELATRLYTNDGKGNFARTSNLNLKANSMTVTHADIDGDGDEDIFIGGRTVKAKYPYPPTSYILVNENGKFTDKTAALAPDLLQIGMVTDAEFYDADADGDQDLVLVGEWLAPTFFENNGGKFARKKTTQDDAVGWWNSIEIADFNADGKADLVLGNLGLNYKFSASEDKPFKIFCDDFDDNGTADIVLAKPIKGELYPVRGKMCSSEQMPFIKDKFPTFNDYANADLNDIYGRKLNDALQLEARKFASCILLHKGNWDYDMHDLPNEAQLSPINDIIAHDFNQDGNIDLLTAGNLFGSEVETTRADAGTGTLMHGDGKGNFKPISYTRSGFYAAGDVRRMTHINNQIIVLNNNGKHQQFTLNR